VYEREKREGSNKSTKIKKARISPQQKVAEQYLAMKKAYEEKLQDMNNTRTAEDSQTETTTTTTTTTTGQ